MNYTTIIEAKRIELEPTAARRSIFDADIEQAVATGSISFRRAQAIQTKRDAR